MRKCAGVLGLGWGLVMMSSVWADALVLQNKEGRVAEYAGSVSLSGRFERRQDAESLDWRGDRICFYPDAESSKRLPASGKNQIWLCFSNHRAAVQMLGLAPTPPAGACGVMGTAHVVVSRYVAEGGTAEVFDQAWLDKVVQQSAPAPLRCN